MRAGSLPDIDAATAGAARDSERAWRRAQALSGLALTLFTGVHLVNAMLAALPGRYDAFQRVVRVAYQSPVVELLLVALPLLVHVAAGVRALARRERSTATAPLRTRLHRWAAWYLLLVITGHVLATRGTELLYGVYPESLGLHFAIAWIPWFFLPYYALLALGGLYHAAHGTLVALGRLGVRVPSASSAPSRFWPVIALASALLLAGIAGMAGWLYAQPDPFASEYAEVYRAMARDGWPVPHVPDARAE